MDLNAESYGRAVILNVKGELTEDSLEAFRRMVEHHLGNKEVIDLVINMEEVPFIDSAALEYLLDVQDQLATKVGQVKVANCSDNILKILEITRLTETFEIFDDIPQAVKAMQV